MERTWTDEAAREWKERRNALRKARGLPSLDELRASGSPRDKETYENALNSERQALQSRLKEYYTKTYAWEVRRT